MPASANTSAAFSPGGAGQPASPTTSGNAPAVDADGSPMAMASRALSPNDSASTEGITGRDDWSHRSGPSGTSPTTASSAEVAAASWATSMPPAAGTEPTTVNRLSSSRRPGPEEYVNALPGGPPPGKEETDGRRGGRGTAPGSGQVLGTTARAQRTAVPHALGGGVRCRHNRLGVPHPVAPGRQLLSVTTPPADGRCIPESRGSHRTNAVAEVVPYNTSDRRRRTRLQDGPSDASRASPRGNSRARLMIGSHMLVGDASTLELRHRGTGREDIVGQPDDTSFTNRMRECLQDPRRTRSAPYSSSDEWTNTHWLRGAFLRQKSVTLCVITASHRLWSLSGAGLR